MRLLSVTVSLAVAAVTTLGGCGKSAPPAEPSMTAAAPPAAMPPAPAAPAATPDKKEPAMIFSTSEDRLPPPKVPPVELDGVRYAQAKDGRGVGASQVGGILVATDIASGKQLWTLPVYGNTVDAKLEADVQWVFFTSMKPNPDGRLRISNEAGKTFLVDVKARTVSAAP